MAGTLLIEVAKKLAKKGYVEVVKRAADGTIQQIVKVGVGQVGKTALNALTSNVAMQIPTMGVSAIGDVVSTVILKKAISKVDGKMDIANLKLDYLAGGINDLKQSMVRMDLKLDGLAAGINGVSDQVRNVAGNIALLQNSVQTIASMNVLIIGFEAINLVVTAKGFAMMNTKLNSIIDSISGMQETLRKIAKKQELDIVREFKEVKDNYADMLDAAKRHTPYTEKEYYQLTGKLHAAIDYLYACFMSDAVENKTAILEAIYVLLPMYANVLRKYDTEYYFKYKDEIMSGSVWHNLHDEWMNTFNSLMTKEYLDKYQDYCFLEAGMSSRQADTALLTAYLTAVNSATVVDDNQKILLCFEQQDEYKKFQGELIEVAEETVQESLTEYDDEMIQQLNPGFKNASLELAASI